MILQREIEFVIFGIVCDMKFYLFNQIWKDIIRATDLNGRDQIRSVKLVNEVRKRIYVAPACNLILRVIIFNLTTNTRYYFTCISTLFRSIKTLTSISIVCHWDGLPSEFDGIYDFIIQHDKNNLNYTNSMTPCMTLMIGFSNQIVINENGKRRESQALTKLRRCS